MSGFIFEAVKSSVIENAFEKALNAAKEQILTDCNYYCRQDQGILIDSSRIDQSGMKLTATWNTPYAKRVYYTGTPSKQVNPNASLQWCEKAHDTYGGEWAKILEKGMSKNL